MSTGVGVLFVSEALGCGLAVSGVLSLFGVMGGSRALGWVLGPDLAVEECFGV